VTRHAPGKSVKKLIKLAGGFIKPPASPEREDKKLWQQIKFKKEKPFA
jgi:hypothetical protein